MEGTGRPLRQLDGRRRQYARDSGRPSCGRGYNGVCSCYGFYLCHALCHVSALGHRLFQKFNAWTKADTRTIDEVGLALEQEAKANTRPLLWQNIMILAGSGLLVSAVSQILGTWINGALPFFDKATWTVLIVTLLGVLLALTPFGKIKGTEEISNVLLYIVIALIASRADLASIGNAPVWLLTGLMILVIHIGLMLLLAKLLKLDIFTCAVASLANIGGTATAPVLAGTYSSALVPVGIVMALLGYVVEQAAAFWWHN